MLVSKHLYPASNLQLCTGSDLQRTGLRQAVETLVTILNSHPDSVAPAIATAELLARSFNETLEAAALLSCASRLRQSYPQALTANAWKRVQLQKCALRAHRFAADEPFPNYFAALVLRHPFL